MKVSIELSPEYRIPYAVIYADKITDEIQKIMESFSRQETPITALQNEENLVVLQPEEIYMVRVEAGDTILFGKCSKYRSRKRLYELETKFNDLEHRHNHLKISLLCRVIFVILQQLVLNFPFRHVYHLVDPNATSK